MKEKHYDSIIEEIWPKLKKKHLYPGIPIPKIKGPPNLEKGEAEEDEGVGLEMKQKQMTINGAFVSKMKGKMEEKESLRLFLITGLHITLSARGISRRTLSFIRRPKK